MISAVTLASLPKEPEFERTVFLPNPGLRATPHYPQPRAGFTSYEWTHETYAQAAIDAALDLEKEDAAEDHEIL